LSNWRNDCGGREVIEQLAERLPVRKWIEELAERLRGAREWWAETARLKSMNLKMRSKIKRLL